MQLLYSYLDILSIIGYDIDKLISLISTDNLQKSENEQWFGHFFITSPVGKSPFCLQSYSISKMRKMCTKHSWFWLTPDRVSSLRRQGPLMSPSCSHKQRTTRLIPFTECPCIITAWSSSIANSFDVMLNVPKCQTWDLRCRGELGLKNIPFPGGTNDLTKLTQNAEVKNSVFLLVWAGGHVQAAERMNNAHCFSETTWITFNVRKEQWLR